jgi:hypothetical protein
MESSPTGKMALLAIFGFKAKLIEKGLQKDGKNFGH